MITLVYSKRVSVRNNLLHSEVNRKMVFAKSQVVTKLNVTKSRLHCTCENNFDLLVPYEQLCNMQVLMHNNAKTAQIEKKRASNMFSLLRYPMYIGTFWDMNFLEIYVILKQNSKKKHWQLCIYL